MKISVKIPSPGESITEVVLARWLVKTGDYVEKDQEIAEIDSEKATLAISAEESGEITVMAAEEETLEVGYVIAEIDTSAKAPEKKVQKEQPPKEEKAEVAEEKVAEPKPAEVVEEKSELKLTPLAKKKLKDEGISEIDLENYLKKPRLGVADVRNILVEMKGGSPVEATRDENRNKMTPLRKKISERLVAVKNETAMLTTFNEIDMSAVIDLRNKYKQVFLEKHGVKLGFMSFFAKAVSIALKEFPTVNGMIDGDEIVEFTYSDIAIAVSTPKGLMAPVVRDANAKTLSEIEIDIAKLAEKARTNSITLDELKGGTFTITNGGVFGSLLSTPIINPPQSAILGMHNIVERPVAVNSQVVIRPMMYVALSYDHRIIDGKESVGFVMKVKELIENPEKLLLEGADPLKKLLDL